MEERAAETFAGVTHEHQLQVLHDDGLYRHLRCRRPTTILYQWDVITWPGYLAIDGDLQSGLIFSRVDDMLAFFASGSGINPSYWGEKITNHTARDGIRQYSRDAFDRAIEQEWENKGMDKGDDALLKMQDDWRAHCLSYDLEIASEAYGAVQSFPHFYDPMEMVFDEWTMPFLLTCHALRWTALKYREGSHDKS